MFDYKKFAKYEKDITKKQVELTQKYPLICIDEICHEKKNSNQEWEKYGTPMATFRGFLHSDKNISKLYDVLTYNKNYYISK